MSKFATPFSLIVLLLACWLPAQTVPQRIDDLKAAYTTEQVESQEREQELQTDVTTLESLVAELEAELADTLIELEACRARAPPVEPPAPPTPGSGILLPSGTLSDWPSGVKIESGKIYDGQGKTIIDYKGAKKAFEYNQDGVHFRNIIWRNGGSGPQGVNAMVRPGRSGVKNVTFENCIFEYAVGCNFSGKDTVNLKVIGGESRFAGQLGVAASGSTNAQFRNFRSHHNVRGLSSDPGWGNSPANGTPRAVKLDGLWYPKEGFEAGGAKFTRTKGLLLDNCEWTDNRGKNCWFDIENVDSRIINNRFDRARSVGNVSWGGVGLLYELNPIGGLVIDGGSASGNEGPGISINESRKVEIKNFTFDGDSLAMRNNKTRRAKSGIRDILITGNKFLNGAKLERLLWDGSGTDAAMKIVISGNVGLN